MGSGGPAGLAFRNPAVQRLRRLARQARARRDDRAFVVEGPTLVAAALAAGAPVEAVYVADGYDGEVLTQARDAGVAVQVMAPGVLERAASTVTPQPVLAVVATLDVALPALRSATLVVVCAEVRDPGNLGTVLRSALAAGASGIICCDGSTDAYNPKCVRASAGALFHLPMVTGEAAEEVLAEVGSWGLQRLGAQATGGTAYDATDLRRPTALVLGNEARGLPAGLTGLLDATVSIPMAKGSESLNVAAAAAVLCFEAARQRRAAG